MNSTFLTTALSFVEKALPFITASQPLIGAAVQLVIDATPIVVREYQDLKPKVLNIIAALKASPETNLEELKKLREAEVALDARFDAAAAKALQEDAEDGQT